MKRMTLLITLLASPVFAAEPLDLAAQLGADGKVIQATDAYQQYVRKHGDDAQAQLNLARALEAQGRFAEAVEAYNRFLRQPGDAEADQIADVQFTVADVQDHILNNLEKATEAYRAFIEANPKDHRLFTARHRIARMLDRARQYQEAADAYRAAIDAHPDHPDAADLQRRLAQICDQWGMRDWERAAVEYQRYVDNYPDRLDTRERMLRMAHLYRDTIRQYDKAVDAYDAALKMEADEDTAWHRLEALWKTGDYDRNLKALTEFEKAYPDSRHIRDVRMRIAYVFHQTEKTDKAIEAWEQIARDFPAHADEAHWQLLHRYEEAEQWAKAYEHVEAMLNMDSEYGGYHRCARLVQNAVKSGDEKLIARAEQTLIELLDRAGHLSDYQGAIRHHLGKSIYLEQRKDYDQAIAQMHAMIEHLPYDGWVEQSGWLTPLVTAYRGKDDLQGAIEAFRAFHKKYPASRGARLARATAAQLFVELNNDEAALAEASQVIDHDLDDAASAEATLTAAECCAKLGDEMKMLALMTRASAMRLESWHQHRHNRIDDLRKRLLAPMLEGGEPDDPLKRAMLHHGLGDFNKAIEAYDAFLDSPAATEDAAGQVAPLRAAAANLLTFEETFKGGELAKLPSMSLRHRAYDYDRNRSWSDAVNANEALIKRSPLDVEARINLAQCYANLGAHSDSVLTMMRLIADYPDVHDAHRHKMIDTWHRYWKDASQVEKLRQIITTAAAARPQPASHYWAYYLHKDYEPKQPQVALEHAELYDARRAIDHKATFGAVARIRVLIDMKRHADAARAAEAWLADHDEPGYMDYMMLFAADAWNDAGDKEQAIDWYVKIVEQYPDTRYGQEARRKVTDMIEGERREAVLRKFIEDNPDSQYGGFSLWRLPEASNEADPAQRLKVWQRIWNDYRGSWWESMWAVRAIVRHYAEQEKHDEAAKMAQEAIDYFGARNEVTWAWDHMLTYLRDVKKDEQAFLELAAEMTRRYGQSYYPYGSLNGAQAAREYLIAKGDHVQAAIVMQRAAAMMSRNDPKWGMDQVIRAASEMAGNARYEEAATFVRTALANLKPTDPDLRARAENAMGAWLSQSGGGLSVIDPNLPQAGLLQGDVFARAGEDALAYKQFLEHRDLFEKYKHDLSPTYILLIARRLAETGEIEAAVDLCRSFIIKRQKDERVTDADRAAIQLLLGDCYFREQRFEIARSEYATCANLYPDTPHTVKARFKVGESYMAQKMFDKATEVFNELMKADDEDTVIRAMLMLGFLYHAEGKQQETIAQFRKVLAMNPRSAVADELFYRMGIVYQESGKLREAYELYRLVGSGGRESKRLVAPGTQLFFRLTDRDLNITRGEGSVPIEAESTCGDVEQVMLHETEAGTGIFVGDIPVALGPAAPGDRVLQVRGTDTIVYRYHPDFARDFVLAESPIEQRTIRVASDARLDVSGSEIADEDDDAEATRHAIANWTQLTTAEGRRIFRRADEIKPGNNIYVRVIDRDMDRTDQRDTIAITVSADSGDRVEMNLEETGEHTGIFRAAVKTGERPPDAAASDDADGHAPSHTLDGDAATAWESRHDGKRPKWLAVDLKQVYPVTRMTWQAAADAPDRAPRGYMIQGSLDGKQWTPLAIAPAEPGMLTGVTSKWNPDGATSPDDMLQGNGDVRTAWEGKHSQNDYIIDLDFGSVTALTKAILRPQNGHREVRAYTLFVETDPGVYPGSKRDMDGWRAVYNNRLDEPVVDEAELKDAVGRYVRLLITESFHEKPDIGELEFYPVLPKPAISLTDDGAAIEFEPTRCRYVRMFITQFNLDAPAVGEVSVWAGDHRIAPGETDLSELANNSVLEISPGDEIAVTYNDMVNITAGEPNVCRQTVRATYYDGHISAIRHAFYDGSDGYRRKVDWPVYRVQGGDRFVVKIVDYDADTSDGIDTIAMTATTESGETIKLTATETGPYDGVFTKEVDTALTKTDGRLLVKPGERITIAYVDAYNTDPGNRTDRTAEVQVVAPTSGNVTIRSAREGDVKAVSLDEPMVIEVVDPDRAQAGEDTVTVNLRTTTGDTAEVECFLRTPEGVPYINPQTLLKEGRFIGAIRLMLGDKTSPDTVVEALKVDAQSYRMGMRKGVEEAVLNVSGEDEIIAEYEDAFDRARLICDAVVGFFDDEYEHPVDSLHVGEHLYVAVIDPDADVSSSQDKVTVTFESSGGDKWTGELTETLSHSGVFTRAVMLEQASQPDPADDQFAADFDTDVTLTYNDARNLESPDPIARQTTAKVVPGSDGLLSAFGKKYPEIEVAVETQFKIAECYYYLGRRHMELAEGEKKADAKEELTALGKAELAAGQRILDELVRGYPDTPIMDQACYLLASLAQEQQRYDEAIEIFRRIGRDWPDSPVAAEAQYKIGMCFEKKGDFETACDEYVRLAYKHPDSTLVGDAMIRIGLHLFDDKQFAAAVGVYERFIEKYPTHTAIEEVWFKMGLALIAQEKFADAAAHYQRFVEKYPESPLKASAIYWAGDSYMKGDAPNAQKAYQMFKRVVWDFPESKWAKWARGQLTSPVFERME